ncbi:MAG TPA: RluA family pseudouridine synthase [Clostridiales bacterium]|nr:RluA family pseudouridine synthase [Clostridiales bacterium]HPV01512.1 RluA family pseudouridine synthase [Clostridiales bacterium]
MRNETFAITTGDAGKRLDVWLTNTLGDYSRSYVERLIEQGNVTVGGKTVKAGYKLKDGDTVQVGIPEPKPLEVTAEDIPLDIIYEDEDIIVINKPRGMVVHPAAGNYSGTLVNALLKHCSGSLSDINGVIRPGIVHRIDKDTSGVLVIAKNNSAHAILSGKLKEHDVNRIYIAVAEGNVPADRGKVDAPIGRHPVDRKKMAVNMKNGRRAVTHFRVLERFKSSTLLELKLETGRTHQIRVHMAYIGHPLVGDTVYGRKKQKYGFEGQALHAAVLGFTHPRTGEYVEFSADPPQEFRELVEKLRQEK